MFLVSPRIFAIFVVLCYITLPYDYTTIHQHSGGFSAEKYGLQSTSDLNVFLWILTPDLSITYARRTLVH